MKIFLSTIIVFWNLENFFDFRASSQNPSERAFSSRGEKHWTRRRFQTKANSVAKILLDIADKEGDLPDMICLAEIENDDCLRSLVYSGPLCRLGYRFIHYDSSDPRGIDCAVLYRPSSMDVTESFVIPFQSTRDVLVCCSDSLTVFTVHLPSKLGSGKDERRREILRQIGSLVEDCGSRVVVIGDFNEQSGPSDTLLLPLHELTDSSAVGTIRFQGQWETIDRCFTNISDATLRVFFSPLLLENDNSHGGQKPRRTYSGPRYLGGLSDHLPIILTF